MFGWIGRVYNWAVSNIGGPVVGWVHDVVHGIWGFLNGIFGNVGDAWHYMWTAGNDLWNAAGKFAAEVWSVIYHLWHVVLPGILRWAERELGKLGKFIDHVYHWALGEIAKLYHWIDHEVMILVKWVMTHIWDPLWKSLTLAWKWIYHEGTIVYYYITHPDKLVALIFDTLIAQVEREAWRVGGLLGKFFLALIMHNIRQFVLLIEDIVSAVL